MGKQKDIDKGLKAIEKLKSSLMPESYEELIKIYKDKQKDLNIEIMESAGGLGEMLGEGGRAGFDTGGSSIRKYEIPPKVWPLVVEMYEKAGGRGETGMSLKEFAFQYFNKAKGGRVGMMYGGDPGFAFSYGGSWADWKDNHASEMPLMDYINQKLPKARHPFSDTKYNSGGPVHHLDGLALSIFQKPYAQLTSSQQSELDNFKPEAYEPIPKAKGGRIGMAGGMSAKRIDSKKRELYYKFNRDNYMNLFEYLQSGQSDRDLEGDFKKGGRVGFQDGTGIMSQTGIPYYADKAVEGIVNSAETLSKLPFAGGELISKLLRQKPNKKMFTDALENITPGSWAENLGISSLAEAEGAKVSDKQRAIGDVLGLGTEMAVPVGVAFKTGQNLINQASKVFGKLKKGKTLDQTINDKITDFGQSRRDFNILAGTSGLMVALKAIGLGSIFKAAPKKAEDFMVTLKTTIDDSDVMTDIGPVATGKWAGDFDISALSGWGKRVLYGIMSKNRQATKVGDKSGVPKNYENINSEDALDIVEQIKKAGGNIKFEHWDDAGGRSVEELLASFKKTFGENSGEYKRLVAKFKKMTEKERVRYHSSITGDYGEALDHTGDVDEILDAIYGKGKGKGEGGIIGLQEGGDVYNFGRKVYPPSLRHPDSRDEAAKKREDAAFEGIWRGAPPSMRDKEKYYRTKREAEHLKKERLDAFVKKVESNKFYPYADMTEKEFAKAYPKVYDMMKKDPGWNWKDFQKVSFVNPGETYQSREGIETEMPLGRTNTEELELFLTPFGVTNYEMSNRGPFNNIKIMSDYDKAAVALHELRHKNIITDDELVAAQPPLAEEDILWRERGPERYPVPTIDDTPAQEPKGPPVYRHANPKGSKEEFSSPLSMHEVFIRYLDDQYGHTDTPSGPYFDKIWRDEWKPYFEKYEKILKKRKDPEEGLEISASKGGRIWRPKSAPKLTTTIPPERGPTPQGLTYLTGDDIVQNIG